jgi:hypothetical protein
MTGDSASGPFNGGFAEILIDFLDGFAIPYTFALGNHDGEGGHDDEDISRIFAGGKHSLFDRGPGSIHGFSNSAINLLDPTGRVVYSMITIDSNRYRDYPGGSSSYDYVYPDQSLWYEWYLNGLSKQQGRAVKSMLFYHIPLLQINELRADMEKVDPAGAAFAFRESPCPAGGDAGFFKKVQELASTTHMFFGHDHRNVLNYAWGGVNWVYGLKTGTSAYHDNDRIGGTLITIGQDGNPTIQFVYEVGAKASERLVTRFQRRLARPKVRELNRE